MAEQLTFELADPPPATFASFVAGPNIEAVDALERVARHVSRETGIVVWGAPGAGKTHLLRGTVAAALAAARDARYVEHPSLVDSEATGAALVAVDNVDDADDAAAARLFTLYNALAARSGQLIVAARVPPARMSLRDDIRTRLGWGLVYEVVALSDAQKPEALRAFARARGFALSGDVIDYLLAHGRRDMASLVHALTALDRHSLALRRPITVPLIRDWLQREIRVPDRH